MFLVLLGMHSYKFIHIIIYVAMKSLFRCFLPLPSKRFKENSTSTKDLLSCPRWGGGLLGCPFKGFLCPWSGVGQWLLSLAAAAAAEADCKWPFGAREKSCCCILLPRILHWVLSIHLWDLCAFHIISPSILFLSLYLSCLPSKGCS